MRDPSTTNIAYKWQKEERSFHSFTPPDTLLGIGAVVTEWSLFEQWFDNSLNIWRWNPAAAKLAENVPSAFKKRANLMRKSVAAALPECFTIHKMMDGIVEEALRSGRKRNLIMHSHWFHHPECETIIHPSIDGSKQRYIVLPADLFELAKAIKDLQRRITILTLCYHDGFDDIVPLHETLALRDHFEKNRPTVPSPTEPAPPPQPLLP